MTRVCVADVELRLGVRRKTMGVKRKIIIADYGTGKTFVMHQGRKQYVQQRHGYWYSSSESEASRRFIRK